MSERPPIAARAAARRPFRELLALPDFRRVWIGQVLSSVADRFYQFALLNVVLQLGPKGGLGAGPESARVLFCGMVLPVVLSPWIGHFVDTHGRRAVLAVSDFLRALLATGILALWAMKVSNAVLFGMVAVMGFLSALFIAARQAAVPALVPEARLVNANALITVVGIIASLVGAAAGLMVSIFGETSSFIITALAFLAAGMIVRRVSDPLRPDGARPTAPRLGSGFALALRVWRDRPLRRLFWIAGGAQFVTGLFLIFVVQHVAAHVRLDALAHAGDRFAEAMVSLGFKRPRIDLRFLALVSLLLASAAGLALAVMTTGRQRRLARYDALPAVMFAALGIVFAGFAWVTGVGAALALAVVAGWCAGTLAIPLEARLQTLVPDAERGRVFAARNAWINLCFLLALAVNLDGTLLTRLGAPLLMQWLGAVCAIGAVALVITQPASLRRAWGPGGQAS